MSAGPCGGEEPLLVQPEVEQLEEGGAFRGSVLEVGCGAGAHALLLAERGHPVLGVDGSPLAVERARAGAAARGLRVRFAVCPPHGLAGLRERFDTALDAGVLHKLADAERRPYAEALAEALASGSTLHLLCVSDAEPPGPGPRRLAEWDIRSTFRGLFVVSAIRPARYLLRPGDGGASAWLATLTRI